MTSNFDFLKNIDPKLFSIAEDAEKLYRDGYFEQTIGQTRKFGEFVSKNVLGVRRTTEETFDEILGTLKDILGDNPADREFMDDLYFIKKQGNLAVHGSASELGGDIALECLKRAFEVSINYALKLGRANKRILNSTYSIDVLMTGKKGKKDENLSEKYEKAKDEALKKEVVKLAKFAQSGDETEDELKTVSTKTEPKKAGYKTGNKTDKRQDKKNKKEYKGADKKNIKSKKYAKKKSHGNETDLNIPLSYILTGGILLVFLVGILIFVLP